MDTVGLVHRVCWTPATLPEQQTVYDTVAFLIPDNDGAYNKELITAYEKQLATEGYATAVLDCTADILPIISARSILVHIPHTPTTKEVIYEAVTQSCLRLVEAAQLLRKYLQSGKCPTCKLVSLTTQHTGTAGLAYAPLTGLARVLKMEAPNIFGGMFETDRLYFPTSAILSAHVFDVVRIRNGTAQTASLQPFPDEPSAGVPSRVQPSLQGTYLITGGTRGMGLEIATWLGERGARNLLLVSRQGIPTDHQDSTKRDASVEKLLLRIKMLEATGTTAHVLAIDLSKPGAGSELSQSIERLGLPPVKGVVHAAGIAGYHTLERCSPTDMAEVLAPKIVGALTLDHLFPPGTLDFFVLISSFGQLVGFEGQLSYAPANAFLEGLAAHRRHQGDNSTSILWSCWRGVGLNTQSKSVIRIITRGMQARGFDDISQEEAFAAWDRIAGLDTDHAAVVRAVELDADEPPRHPMLRNITPRRTGDVRSGPRFADYPQHAVAVVGLACQTAAGETAEDLWQCLLQGKSMAREMTPERFPDIANKPKMWANLMSHVECFDHQFFKKTRREAVALDPHQRLLLQTTYHALECAGWLGGDKKQSGPEVSEQDDDGHTTGCFVGMNAPDWPLNLASNAVSPYTGGGMLRSFAAGRLSHHFGWTGPSQTIDTACSSSMVAIHQACRALQLGECTRAVAGGANLITNTALFDAMRIGGFLSETGPCKTFDARADGYCRGEAVGVVVLKPLRAALADGDDIRGVLLATGNNQNVNSTSITNPVLESQTALYRDVLARAGVDPSDVSYVEAHGTGTRVGDPVEMGAIRQVLGGKNRPTTLHVGAVKANIGHTEGASGVISLIKVLLMMRYGKITPQAQFNMLNPNIQPLEPDRLAIATSLQDWSDSMRLALVNSYGASGNNAVAVVAPAPSRSQSSSKTEYEESVAHTSVASIDTLPIIISAASATSLFSYCEKLKVQIEDGSFAPGLHDLAFTLATKRSRHHQQLLCTTAKSLSELQIQLSSPERHVSVAQRARPVVLLFSGQNGNTVPPAQHLYNSSVLFRKHLHQCDEAICRLGLPSLFPAILGGLQGDGDLILRHAAMFAIQYSSAMSWLDSCLQPQAVCGHSFGEWAAATVSGIMTLEDGMRLVTSRASIIQRLWGEDTGSMVTIEAELVKTNKTPAEHLEPFFEQHPESTLSVACYNGPNHYVVAGPTLGVKLLESYLKGRKSAGEALRFKVLKGMHAYHCAMADSIVEESGKLSATVPFKRPVLRFESCHKGTWTGPGSNVIASNTRGPVYFMQAIERITDSLGPCIFLEAGFGGPIISMARNAIPRVQAQAEHVFVAINGTGPARSLTNGIITLWKNGLPDVQFWPFHKDQRASYATTTLPPYQFEKNSHWLDYTPRLLGDDTTKAAGDRALMAPSPCPHCLKHPSEFPYIIQDATQSQQGAGTFVFKVDPRSRRYQEIVQGHAVVGSPICPAAMYLELATLAVSSLEPYQDSEMTVKSLAIKAPLGLLTERSIGLSVTKKSPGEWDFELCSTQKDDNPTSHATGTVILGHRSVSDQGDDTDRWARITRLLDKDTDADALRGSMVYKVFSSMAKYSAPYRGLKHLAAKGAEGAGDIAIPTHNLDPAARTPNDSIADPFVVDTFLQVPGAFIHSLRDIGVEDGENERMSYICTGIDTVSPMNWQSPTHGQFRAYTQVVRENQNKVWLDVFALDKQTLKTIWSAKSLEFTRIPRLSLAKLVAGANANIVVRDGRLSATPLMKPAAVLTHEPLPAIDAPVEVARSSGAAADIYLSGVREVLSQSLDIPAEQVIRTSTLEELGADSLVSPEIIASISKRFNTDISSNEFSKVINVASLCALILSKDSGEDDSKDPGPKTVHQPVVDDVAPALQDTIFQILSDSLGLTIEDIRLDSNLEDLGIDSLVSGEIISKLNEAFYVEITSAEFSLATDVASACHLITESLGVSLSIGQARLTTGTSINQGTFSPIAGTGTLIGTKKQDRTIGYGPVSIHTAFQQVRGNFDMHAKDTKLTSYWDLVYPQQLKVVAAFIVEGFDKLGCPIKDCKEGEKIVSLGATLPKYQREVSRLWDILEEACVVVKRTPDGFLRSSANPFETSNPTSKQSARELSAELIGTYPQFASSHGLLDLLGPHLAECLTGRADPVCLLFGSDTGRALLKDFYTNGPDLWAATQVLSDFVAAAIHLQATASLDGEPFRILEIGAGTGGTTRHLVPLLRATGLPFTYTFTDLSVSLVAQAKMTPAFGGVSEMEFRKLNIEESPPIDMLGCYHLAISSNCVHATRDLRRSLTHIRQLLHPRHGCLALVELTQKLAWYDLVWGLLDGWWLFDDSRAYPLQSPWAWERCMRDAGFACVDWSEGATRESRSVRVICGLATEPDPPCLTRATSILLHRGTAAASSGASRNLFLVPDGTGSAAVFRPLAPLLARAENVSFFALNNPFTMKNKAAELDLRLCHTPTIEQLAAMYLAELKRRQPEGPYLIGGYSIGGVVAYEIARQLLEEADVVEKVFLIDTACPTFATSLSSALVDHLESIGDFSGVDYEGRDCQMKNDGLLKSYHFTQARRQLATYQARPIPGRRVPHFVLFSAREGVDKQNRVARPLFTHKEKRVAQWFLDDRPEGSLGWNEFLGSSVSVVRADGNHFSMMRAPNMTGWGLKLIKLLE
ncbi:BcPKS20, polyketide synthase [Rhexocercosporidium sp. MPI-PUGE-AT-0058]|nr:BcPKS20, polyketide synthase [Rhexocercosporidium sp. MPI-PUGE-AT-0058]